MNDLIRRSVAKIQQSRKLDVLWSTDEPCDQEYYSCKDGVWAAHKPGPSNTSRSISTLALYSWNIDFMLPFGDSRMRQALSHLQQQVSSLAAPATTATVIFLQECTHSDLDVLANHEWVRNDFYLTDLSTANWTSGHYGTVTLIDKRLVVARCFRIHYEKTNMERDAFFTDVLLGPDNQILRLCNSHLESMAFDPPMRSHQVSLASRYMHEASAAAIAGDFNAIQDFDRHLHTANDLKDAYLELGGSEDSEEGYTWGQQAATFQREQFGCSRMDKVFYCGALHLKSFDRFGADVLVEDEDKKAELVSLGFDKAWITDHLGVKAVFDIS